MKIVMTRRSKRARPKPAAISRYPCADFEDFFVFVVVRSITRDIIQSNFIKSLIEYHEVAYVHDGLIKMKKSI